MVTRRNFLKLAGLAAGSALTLPKMSEASTEPKAAHPDARGCLVDLTLCIGCRQCESACNQVNALPRPGQAFDDLAVLDTNRRMDIEHLTVVNRYKADDRNRDFVNVKTQCMHCVDPGCVSACLVGAMRKTPEGPVTWDNAACIGCRYCMIACPFGVPAYEYGKGIEPKVVKCTFCAPRIAEGEDPGCAKACPMEALKFGPRAELLEVAHKRLEKYPKRYVNHVYGEHEVGGTSWMYVAPQSFASLDFLPLPGEAPPRLTETIQHGVFKYFALPVLLYSGLGVAMRLSGRGHSTESEKDGSQTPTPDQE